MNIYYFKEPRFVNNTPNTHHVNYISEGSAFNEYNKIIHFDIELPKKGSFRLTYIHLCRCVRVLPLSKQCMPLCRRNPLCVVGLSKDTVTGRRARRVGAVALGVSFNRDTETFDVILDTPLSYP